MTLLIGRRALSKYFETRQTSDWDIIISNADGLNSEELREKKEGIKAKFSIPDDERLEVHQLPNNIYDRLAQLSENSIVNPVGLYSIKLSHSFWDIHWNKTAFDISFFQKNGVNYNPTLFNLLYKFWLVKHGQKRANLNKTNEEFFKDAVKRRYIHDDIHKAVAYYEKPLYERIKHDTDLALTSRPLFDKLDHIDKIRLCREEIHVTALERFLIPKDFHFNVKVAYRAAIKNLVTSMTKGYFPFFIMQNITELMELDKEFNFVDRFRLAVMTNKVRYANGI